MKTTNDDFPVLYKKTSTGKIQQWEIGVEENVIWTRFGQLGGKIQETADEIREGKNIGKSNETSAAQQAYAEAKSQHAKKLKKDYCLTIADAEGGIAHESIKGGILPMLAKEYAKFSHKIVYPCMMQPKLDGFRCIAIKENGIVTLWSRTRKQWNSVPHIVDAVTKHLPNGVYDGELYNHELCQDDFEELAHLVSRKTPIEGHEIVQYYIYDLPVKKQTFRFRSQMIQNLFGNKPSLGPLIPVEVFLANNPEKAQDAYEQFLDDGYEGGMYRTPDSEYETGKRSLHLIKRKEWQDTEMEIIGIEEGRGKLQGHAAVAVCRTPDGGTCKPTFKMKREKKREFFLNPPIGKLLTVQFQNLTKKEKPRFLRGIRLREPE